MDMGKQRIGVIGMAVMGRNLALNIADHGYTVSVYNRSPEKTKEMMRESKGKPVKATWSIEEFTSSLETPRMIIMMIKAGDAVDTMIEQLVPYLSPGDILVDGGNSYYLDTERRAAELGLKGIYYLGAGISGGEEGARYGPAIMPGGDLAAYRQMEKTLADISAKADGEPCCAYIGSGGSGHFVKMVHNGIEYGDMQLICEAYDMLRNGAGFSVPQIREIFEDWNKGELNSYLIDITSEILKFRDEETGEFLVDVILDVAEQKGTGKWTGMAALDMGVAIPTITESVFQRYLSSLKEERMAASAKLAGPGGKNSPSGQNPGRRYMDIDTETIRRALYAAKICAYAQGFSLMATASKAMGWGLKLGEIAAIFRGGCIIRAQFLNKIRDAYRNNPDLPNLLMDDYFAGIIGEYNGDWRKAVAAAVNSGIPVPALSSSLSYYDSYRAAVLPMNLLQAQRDYFGAHTYRRTDREGIFHTQWQPEGRKCLYDH